MLQQGEFQQWRQTIIYSIEQDRSAEYEADKIVFHSLNTKQLLSEFENSQKAKLFGIYGFYKDVENHINQTYPDMVEFKFLEYVLNDERGKIIIIHKPSTLIPCLILPLQFFLQKPIDEKSIELTLFRILEDMTQTIRTCIPDQVLSSWYSGRKTPFSDSYSKNISTFVLEQNDQEIFDTINIEVNSMIPPTYSDWKILGSKNQSQQFFLYKQILFTRALQQQLKQSLEKIIFNMIYGLFRNNDSQVGSNMSQNLGQEFATQKVMEKLFELEKYLKRIIEEIHSDTFQQINNLIKRKNHYLQPWIVKNIEKEIFMYLKSALIYQYGSFTFDYNLPFPSIIQGVDISSLKNDSDFSKIKDFNKQRLNTLDESQRNQIPQIIERFQKEEVNENNIIVQRCKFSTLRETNKENTIQKLSMSTLSSQKFIIYSQQIHTSKSLLRQVGECINVLEEEKNQKITLVDFFKTRNENQDMIIVKKIETYSILMIGTTGQQKLIKSLENPGQLFFLYLSQSGYLFGFNHRNTNAVKLHIDENWKVVGETTYFDIQPWIFPKVIQLNFDETFFALNSYGEVFKWKGQKEPFIQIKCLGFDEKSSAPISLQFKPSNNKGGKYDLIEACPSGKRFLLSNKSIIDVYDANHQLIKSIDIKGNFILFADQSDAFFIMIQNNVCENNYAIVIPNLTNNKTIRQVNKLDEETKIGNPFFDIMRGSQVKYGPVQTFLLKTKTEIVNLQIINSKNRRTDIQNYLTQLQLNETCKIDFLEDFKAINSEEYEINFIFRFAYTRVPIQFCTIENNQLTPLIDGFRQVNNWNQSLTIPQRAKILKLGYIEDYLLNLNEKIFVISIIGRQSSGKSYLLNRLFGTRFTVAASRCTDGIWANIVQIKDKQFLILDCEGLFSAQRTKNEEIQLLAFLAGVCDVTILNQDLSFSRHLDELLDNLTHAVGRLTGDSLFKGTLFIALRDICQKDCAGAKEQLLQNLGAKIKSRKSSFLNTLFNNSFNVYLFSNFEHINFTQEINDLRKEFLIFADNSNRWLNGRDLIQTIKILLVQLETQDDENTDELHQRLQIDEAMEKIKKDWISLEADLQLEFKGEKYLNGDYHLWQESEKQIDCEEFCKKLFAQIFLDIGLNGSIEDHNNNYIIVQEFMNDLLQQRKSHLIAQFDEETKSMMKLKIDSEFIKPQKTILLRYIEEQQHFYTICKMQCSQCFLNCTKLRNHSSLLQSQINTKDSYLQNISKKYENKELNIQENENEIAKLQIEEEMINKQVEMTQLNITYYQQFQKWVNLKFQQNDVVDQLQKHSLSDKEKVTSINFVKLLMRYGNVAKLLGKDDAIIEASNNEYLSADDLYQSLEKKQVSLKQIINSQQLQLQEIKLLLIKNEEQEKKVQNQIAQGNNEKKECNEMIDQCEKSSNSFQFQQKDLKQQLLKKQNEFAILEDNLIQQKKIFYTSRNYDNIAQLEQKQRTLEQCIIETSEKILKVKQQYCLLANQLKDTDHQLQQRISSQMEGFTINETFYQDCIENKKKYDILTTRLKKLKAEQEVIEKLPSQQQQFRSQVEKLKDQFNEIDIKKCKTLRDCKKAVTDKNNQLEKECRVLEEDNEVELINSIIDSDILQEDFQKFKEKYKAAKEQELQDTFFEQQKENEEKLEEYDKEQQQLEKQSSDMKTMIHYVSEVIYLAQLSNSEKQLEENIENIKNGQKQHRSTLRKLEIDNQQQQEQLSKLKIDREEIRRQLDTQESNLKELQQHILAIQLTNQYYNYYTNILRQYLNFEQQMSQIEPTLQEWANLKFLRDSSSWNQSDISNVLLEQKQKSEELINQQNSIYQQKQELIFQNKELLIIQSLQNELDMLKKQEKQEHSCLRESHQCNSPCAVCKDKNCHKKAAHQQEHLCDVLEHYCIESCDIEGCEQPCRKQFQHDGQHNCENSHYCKFPCQYCGGDCNYQQGQEHTEHICQLRGCIQKCLLCSRTCNQEHRHSRQEGEVHFCENVHSCDQLCTAPGVCVWEYLEEKREWKTEISTFEYSYFRLIDGGKQCCSIQIESGKISHGENHFCKNEAHRCGAKCPECDGLCTKAYGHDGFHFAKQHRNKDCQVFTLAKGAGSKVEFGEDLETYRYQVGDSSCPETCADSCARRSRSHFHLVKCEGDLKCLQKSNKFARHQKQSYQGFDDIQFDEVQCIEFWKLQQWEHPLCDGDKLANIQGCNFFCPFCPSTKKSFCKLPAWHSDSKKYEDHEFWCKADHVASTFEGLDIAFVIDATGSMSSMIENAKQMIKNIMEKAKLSAGKNIRFGIVAYRDHPPEDTTFVTKIQELGSETNSLKFLSELKAEGGGDYPEAVLDGLQAAVNLKWNSNFDKMIFLIGDAPPHGKEYSNQGRWPEGCPCGIIERNLFLGMQRLQISFKILELNSGLNKMTQKFKEYIDLEVIQENLKIGFVSQVVSKVCQQIEMREITYRKEK